jgi:transposase
VAGRKAWLWVYVGDHASVYDIAEGRGYDQAAAVLGADFGGVLERDGWAPYRRFDQASHQSCLAHLLRRATGMIQDAVAGQAKVPHALRRILNDALAVRDAGLVGKVLAWEVARLEERLGAFCRRTPSHQPNRRLVAHVRREAPHLLTFLRVDGVEATNWEAEQALRAMICNRKQWGGNKAWAGARTTAVLGSVLRTSAQQAADPIGVLTGIQHDGKVASHLCSSPNSPAPGCPPCPTSTGGCGRPRRPACSTWAAALAPPRSRSPAPTHAHRS